MEEAGILGVVSYVGTAAATGAASEGAGGGEESIVEMAGQVANDDGLRATELES